MTDRLVRPALVLASLALAACDSSPQASPIVDAAVTDTGAPKKDAGFIDLDGGPVFDAGDGIPAPFQGEWDRLPGLEKFPIWKARDLQVSASPIRWKPCTPVIAGCEEMVVDWSSDPYVTLIQAASNDSSPFYKEGGRSFFVYRRLFPPPTGGVAYVGQQTVVEEIGVGPRFVLGEAPPFSALAVATFGGGSVGVSAHPRGTRKSYEYALNVDQKTSESAVWELAPLGIPEDDLGIPLNYGYRFSHSSGTAPLTVLSDVRGKTIFGLAERRDWFAQQVRADGLFAMNQSINRLDFIEWAGKVTGLHTPPAGWNLYEFKLDRDSNTLVWFEMRSDNLGRSNLFASPANATALTPRLVRAVDLGDKARYVSKLVINGDLVAYNVSKTEVHVVRLSTGETRTVASPAPYRGGERPWYVDDEYVWEPELGGSGVVSMLRLRWKDAPIVP